MLGASLIESSVRGVMGAFSRLKQAADDAAQAGSKASAEELHKAVLRNASRDDYTLRGLADIDHPFAKRHRTINTGALGGEWAEKPYMIHKRAGEVYRAIEVQAQPGGGYAVVVSPNSEIAKYVVQGTRIMLGRDIIGGTAQEPWMQARVLAAFASATVKHVLGVGKR